MSARAGRNGKSIVIVKTGEPVPSVRERRGHFADLIQQAIGREWAGGYDVVDVVSGDPPPPDAAGKR